MAAAGIQREAGAADGVARPIRPSIGNAFPYFISLLIYPLLIYAALQGGWWIAGPLLFFVLTDSLDSIFGKSEAARDVRSMDPVDTRDRRLIWYTIAQWSWVALYPPVLVFTLWQVLAAGHLATWEILLMALVLGCVARMVYSASHELIHSHSTLERRVGELLLASVTFVHEATEHVYLHHPLVGTPEDTLSAPRGMSFWQYFPRTLVSSVLGSWRVERERLVRRHLPVWHYSNPFWRYVGLIALWYVLAYWMGGALGVVFLFLASAVGIFSLRTIDYVQHYGLQRIRLPNGRFERVQAHHAWSAASKLPNWLYYNQQRHADHHAKPTRRYPLLQHHDERTAPQLPEPYAKLSALALLPRKWFGLMDPEVTAWREQFYPQIRDWSAYDSAAFVARPASFEVIAEILAAAPRLGRWINDSPELLDNLEGREFTDLDLPAGFGPDPESESLARQGLTRLYWTREFGPSEMKEHLAEFPAQGSREAVEVARNFANDKAFQVAVHAIRGNLSPTEAGVAFSNIAEGSIAALLSVIEEEFAGWRAPRDRAGIVVTLLGDPAVGQLAIGTTLDTLSIYDGPAKYFGELNHRFFEALREFSRENLLFSPVPEGQTERPAMALAACAGSFQDAGMAGNLLDLARARQVYPPATWPSRRNSNRRGALPLPAARRGNR